MQSDMIDVSYKRFKILIVRAFEFEFNSQHRIHLMTSVLIISNTQTNAETLVAWREKMRLWYMQHNESSKIWLWRMMTQMKLWMWSELMYFEATGRKLLWDTRLDDTQHQSQIERLLLKNLFRINIHQADTMWVDFQTQQHTIFLCSQLHKMTQ